MKKIFFLSFCLLFLTPSYSQLDCASNDKKGKSLLFIDVYSSAALPLGDYSSNSLNGGSYAKLGFSAGLNVNYILKNNWGLRIAVSGSFNSVDVLPLAIGEVASDPFMDDLSIRSDLYTLINVSASLLYKKELNEKLNLYGVIGAGMLYMETPHQLYRASYLTIQDYFEITPAGDYSAIYHAGIEAEYKLKDSWSLISGLKYSFANTRFVFYRPGQDNRIDKRKINLLDVFLGIRLYL